MTATISGLSLSVTYAEFSMTNMRDTGSTSSTGNIPPTGQAPAVAPVQQGEHPHAHQRLMQAVTMSFMQIGIDISAQGGTPPAAGSGTAPSAGSSTSGTSGTGTSTDPASAPNTDMAQMLQAFMHALFQAMSQLGHAEGRGEHEGDGDGDDAKSSAPPQVAAYTGPAGKVDALLQSVKADAGTPPAATTDTTGNNVPSAAPPASPATTGSTDSTTPAATQNVVSTSPLDSLKNAFAQLVQASGASTGSNTTAQNLQSFLESLLQNLTTTQATTQSFKLTGIFVSFSA